MTTTPVKASVLHGAKDLRIETLSLSPPSRDELQVAVRATGLCGSDLHYYNHYRNGDIIVREPMCLGHESAGIVTAVGASVSDFKVGDNVALEVGIPFGLLVSAVAKIEGAGTVVIADIDQGRVDFAVENGFAHEGFTVPMKRGNTTDENLEIARETAAAIGKLLRADGSVIGDVDAVFECTGVPSCLQAAIYATRPGGRVMLIGMGTPVQTLPISAAAHREVDLVGVFRYANTYPKGIEIISRKGPDDPDFSKLITHRYRGLETAEKAFDMAGKTKDENEQLILKVFIEVDDENRARL
ncbi:MAG: hypothetical protein M1821_003639 [Bathelium mastoideum]|nr:MAG: hypothetical protein M1821_003639 [Bathelium mastoideum]